jgi:osmotically-inducible protein OsmY
MTSREEILKRAFAALEQEPRVGLHRRPLEVAVDGGVVTVSGEVDDVAAKKLALELVGAVPGVTGIVDRLRVTPAEPMEDGDIRDHIFDALVQEQAFNDYTVRGAARGTMETVREAPRAAAGVIEIEVDGGMVTLNGNVGSLSHKRLAGVLAWWVPGSRDVVNGLEVVPPMEDNDDEVVDAVRLALEKDPFVNASQIRVSCRDYVVTLTGEVPRKNEKGMAEADAWYVFRVNRVVNNVIVAE